MTDSAAIGEDFKTPLEMLYHWEQTIPQQTWMRYVTQGQWHDVSWAEAGRQCRKVAAALSALGLSEGDKVGIYGANSPHWIMADIACMMAGLVTVPVYTTMPMDKVSYVVDHSDMRALFVDGGVDLAGLREVLPSNTPLLAMPGGDVDNTDFNWQHIQDSVIGVGGNPLRNPNDLWTIVYTSGTTGMPKGVMHSFSTFPHSASGIPEFTGSDSNSRLFSYLPLAHAAERVLVELQSIYSGALIGFNTSKDSFAADLREIRPTFFLAVPRIWTNLKAGIIAQLGDETWGALLKNPELGKEIGKAVLAAMGMDAVKFAFSGAAPISTTDIQAWRALGMPLYEGFGQSEIMSGTINIPNADRVGSVGKIMEDLGGGLMISDLGEILLRAPGAMLGYYKDPEKTAETLVDGWIRTGDKGRIDEDGFLHITGRVKEIFKTAKGKYVAPAPIENVFAASSHVDQLCLVGSGLPQTLMLVILAPSSTKLKREDISEDLENQRQIVNKDLEAHERISHVIVCAQAWTIENRLLTHTLKILRDDVEKNHAEAIGLCMDSAGGNTVNWE
jgi:long-chain acyl-CoA synthetase